MKIHKKWCACVWRGEVTKCRGEIFFEEELNIFDFARGELTLDDTMFAFLTFWRNTLNNNIIDIRKGWDRFRNVNLW